MKTTWSRRGFLARSFAASAGWLVATCAGAAGAGLRRLKHGPGIRQHAEHRKENSARATRLILLGTAGGPTPKVSRASPAQVILVNGAAYVVDCGNGVARQLRLAGISLRDIRHVFLTHHHSDHNADYGTLLLLAWGSDLTRPVDTWGPPPLKRITSLFLEMSEPDIKVRMADEGRPPLAPLVRPHEITADGVVLRDGPITVTCTRVHHPLVADAYAYRFDTPDRSIVISGDTSPSDALVTLARGADVLVHEAMYLPAVDRLAADTPNPAALRRHLLDSHSPVEEVGRIAAAANVKTLVLSHLVPGEATAVPDDAWREPASRHFKGRVIVGKDLMEV